MNAAQQDPDGPPVEFEHRSAFYGCTRCGAMVWPSDREQHRRHHAAVSRALAEAQRR